LRACGTWRTARLEVMGYRVMPIRIHKVPDVLQSILEPLRASPIEAPSPQPFYTVQCTPWWRGNAADPYIHLKSHTQNPNRVVKAV